MEPQDTITVAPSVLIAIVVHAATQIKGVAHMGAIPVDVTRLLRGNPLGSGVALTITGRTVGMDVYLVLKPGAAMRDVSRQVQQSITRSIKDLIGMTVERVDIHIEDVDFASSRPAV